MAKIKHCICPTKREEGAELRRYSFEIWSDHPEFCMSERVWRHDTTTKIYLMEFDLSDYPFNTSH